ncbi:MAG: hypothetical protein ACI8PT_000816, partial [Gammaproteobacteria bacterium]
NVEEQIRYAVNLGKGNAFHRGDKFHKLLDGRKAR